MFIKKIACAVLALALVIFLGPIGESWAGDKPWRFFGILKRFFCLYRQKMIWDFPGIEFKSWGPLESWTSTRSAAEILTESDDKHWVCGGDL